MKPAWMGRQEATPVMHSLLKSTDGGVRVAAAMSLVRLLKSYRPAVEPAAPPKPVAKAESKPKPPERRAPELHTAGDKD